MRATKDFIYAELTLVYFSCKVEPTLVIQGNDSSQTESDEDETNKITLIFGGGSGQIYGTTGGGDSDSDSETPQTSVDDKEKMYKPDLFGGDVPDNVGDVGDRGPDTSGDGDTTTTGNPPEESEENSQPTSGSTLKAGPAVAIAVGGALLLGMAIYFGQRRLKKGSEGKPDDNTADAPNSNPDIETAAVEA